MRKITKAIASITLMLSAAVYSQTAFAKPTITIWEDVGDSTSLQSAINDFQKYHDCIIKVKEVPQDLQLGKFKFAYDQHRETPDVFVLRGERIAYAARNNLIAPADFMFKEEKNYDKLAIRESLVDGKYYAVPRSIETLLVFYNKDLIPYPYEYLEQYEEYNQQAKDQGKFGLVAKLDEFNTAYSILGVNNGYIFSNHDGSLDTQDVGLNKKSVIQNAKILANYVKNFIPDEIRKSVGTEKLDEMFLQGQAAAVINTSGALAKYAASGINYGVAPLPKLEHEGNMTPFYDIRSYVVAKNSPNKDLCMEFLQFINLPHYAFDRYMFTAQLPPIKQVTESPLVSNDDFANALFKQLQTAKQIPTHEKMDDVWAPMSMALINILDHCADAKVELDTAVLNILM